MRNCKNGERRRRDPHISLAARDDRIVRQKRIERRTGLPVRIIEREASLSRRIELENLRDGEAGLKRLPDIAAQPVAAGKAQPVTTFVRVRRRGSEIAAELTDILKQRASALGDVVPEAARREPFADKNRGAGNELPIFSASSRS